MKKIVTITLVATILTATGITALAAPVTPDSDQKQRNSTVGYDAAPTYSIVIPEEIILKSNDTVEAEITADDIMLEAYQQIEVKLTAASNTESGSTFSAKTADGQSTATYKITAGEQAVSVGDKIAVFEDAGTQTLTFSKAEGATYAGKHTETLTFTISVENVFPIGLTFQVGDTVNLGDNVYVKDYDVAREMSGDYTLEYLQYDYGRHVHNYKLVRGDEKTYFAVSNSYDIRPTAVKVTGGTGTSTDPYTFTAVYAENVSQIGTTFHKGDTVNLGYDIYVLGIHGQSMLIAGDYSVNYSSYNYEMEGHIYYLKGYNKAYILAADKSDKEPTGVTVTGGSGTETDPYTFTAVH